MSQKVTKLVIWPTDSEPRAVGLKVHVLSILIVYNFKTPQFNPLPNLKLTRSREGPWEDCRGGRSGRRRPSTRGQAGPRRRPWKLMPRPLSDLTSLSPPPPRERRQGQGPASSLPGGKMTAQAVRCHPGAIGSCTARAEWAGGRRKSRRRGPGDQGTWGPGDWRTIPLCLLPSAWVSPRCSAPACT